MHNIVLADPLLWNINGGCSQLLVFVKWHAVFSATFVCHVFARVPLIFSIRVSDSTKLLVACRS